MTRCRNNSAKFRTKMPLAVAAVLRCHSLEEAAQSVGISVATLKRWRRRPQFAEALRDAQAEFFLVTTNVLRDAGRECAEVLAKIARDENAPPASRVRAAMAVVTLLMKLRETDDIEPRLRKLELEAQAAMRIKGANR